MTTPIITKICAKCKSKQNTDNFYKDKFSKDGFHRICKTCVKFRQQLRKADQLNFIPTKTIKKFFQNIIKTESCWIWNGKKLPKGYGAFLLNSAKILAHRFSYFYHFGVLPNDLCVCHTCDNPSCVNPNHLFLGTRKDNMKDMVNKGRSRTGEKHHNLKLTEELVLEIRERARNGENRNQMAREYKIHKRHLRAILSRRFWTHI